MTNISKLCQTVFGLALLSCFLYSAQAGNFSVSPVSVTLSGKNPIAALTVRNNSTMPTTVQLQLKQWAQKSGKDVFAPTHSILATPPIFTIQPGKSQIIRLGQRGAPEADRELAYRLFLQEVPPPPKPGFNGFTVALRISMPVFLNPLASTAEPKLDWHVISLPNNQLKLYLKNRGNAHGYIKNIKLDYEKKLIGELQTRVYVLPGQTHEWLLSPKHRIPEKAHLILSAQSNDEITTSDLTL